MRNLGKLSGLFGLLASALTLSGCEWDVLNPAGYVALQERTLIAICVIVMLCVVVPVMIAVVFFAFKYRASNRNVEYLPEWGHSNKVEAFMWGIPICIIIVLAALTAYYTHHIDPSRALPEDVADSETLLQIDAVSLDWKWLFIYPQYNVASINEIYAPKDREVLLQLSSENSINAFWVPRLGTVLYAMPQMNAKLHLVADQEGVFNGVSNNYSGDGFANMRFKWHSVSPEAFNSWIANAHANGQPLNADVYAKLRIGAGQEAGLSPEKRADAKEEDSKVRYFSSVQNDLYWRIVNRCVGQADNMCNENLMIDAAAKSLWGELCSVLEPDLLKSSK